MTASTQRRDVGSSSPAEDGEGTGCSRPVGEGTDDPTSTWRGDAAFLTAAGVLLGVLVFRIFPEVLQGQLADTDSYMRLVRVRRLGELGGWFDSTIPRSNAPFGETLHWTRPLDVFILLGAWILQPFLGFREALHVFGALSSSLLLLGICFTTAWAVRPLAGRRLRYVTMLAVLAQPGIMGYATPGRADHNMLLLLAFVAMVGSAIRVLLGRDSRRLAWATGAWAGFGMWVSTEFLVPLFMLLAAFGVVWVWRGAMAAQGRSVSFGLLAMTGIAVLLEHPPGALLTVAYDQVSVVHVLVSAVVAVFWVAASSRRASGLGSRGRITFAVSGGLLAGAFVVAVFPRFFGGPMVDVHPTLKRTWLPFLTEFQPYLVPEGVAGVGRLVAYLGHALLATAVVLHGIWRERDAAMVRVWILLGIGLTLFVPLGIRWVRFVTWAEILGVMGTIVLLARLLERIHLRFHGRRLASARVLTVTGVVVGPLLLGPTIMAGAGDVGEEARRAVTTQVDACPVGDLITTLNDGGGLGDRPRTVLAHVDLGPVLLYRTGHSVIPTPYHRNWRGMLDWQESMTTRNPDEARRILGSRGVEVVVACGADRPPASPAPGTSPSFVSLLRSGRVPGWLRPSPAPTSTPGLRIYEVVE